jgi:hypothetical protein
MAFFESFMWHNQLAESLVLMVRLAFNQVQQNFSAPLVQEVADAGLLIILSISTCSFKNNRP